MRSIAGNAWGVKLLFWDKLMQTKVILTGGAGFIGSTAVEMLVEQGVYVIVLDALTYAGFPENLEHLPANAYELVHGSITDGALVAGLLAKHQPQAILNFAAESHVDNSIKAPSAFIQTNIIGTYTLLEAARAYYEALTATDKAQFRFVHVSTDEVFGSLGAEGKFHEEYPYQPNSPYSASKAAADHLVRAWFHTYGLPTITTNCTNNYGKRQYPEKLIPLMIMNALQSKSLPVYGDGLNIRDWIHVEDHASGVLLAWRGGVVGESYCFGGNAERGNIEVVQAICSTLDEMNPRNGASYSELITYVTDRKGHDKRYAIDDSKAVKELGFKRKYDFESGLRQTIEWYLNNQQWCDAVLKNSSLLAGERPKQK
jgi:dTDP-glucose 4,6-dehydratase